MIYDIITRYIEYYKIKAPRKSRRPAPTFLPQNIVFILGAPRSGTTWLAAIFDSHKDILYRHEPDIALRGRSIPYPCARTAIARFRGDARNYLLRLAGLCLRNTVRRPLLFRKRYRSAVGYRDPPRPVLPVVADRARLADPPMRSKSRTVSAEARAPRLLIKSVSACGRAGLYAKALPEARFILIVRNPFGQVASMLRGTALGYVDGYRATDRLLGLAGGWPLRVESPAFRDDAAGRTAGVALGAATWKRHWMISPASRTCKPCAMKRCAHSPKSWPKDCSRLPAWQWAGRRSISCDSVRMRASAGSHFRSSRMCGARLPTDGGRTCRSQSRPPSGRS